MSSEIIFLSTTIVTVWALKLFNTLMYCLDVFSEILSSTKHFITLLTFVSLAPVC